MQFVRKAFGTLAFQFSLTTAFIVIVQTSTNLRFWVKWDTETLSIAAGVVLLITMIALVYFELSKKVPINYLLLFVFTLCEVWIFAWVTVDLERVYA